MINCLLLGVVLAAHPGSRPEPSLQIVFPGFGDISVAQVVSVLREHKIRANALGDLEFTVDVGASEAEVRPLLEKEAPQNLFTYAFGNGPPSFAPKKLKDWIKLTNQDFDGATARLIPPAVKDFYSNTGQRGDLYYTILPYRRGKAAAAGYVVAPNPTKGPFSELIMGPNRQYPINNTIWP